MPGECDDGEAEAGSPDLCASVDWGGVPVAPKETPKKLSSILGVDVRDRCLFMIILEQFRICMFLNPQLSPGCHVDMRSGTVSTHARSQLIGRSTVLLTPPWQLDAELCPNKKMIDESRFIGAHSCGGFDKPFQFHPVMLTYLDHFQPDPVIPNLSDFRQPDVDKGLFSFQP